MKTSMHSESLPPSWHAMQRAAEAARDIAIQTNTSIVIWRDGKIVHITADELRAERAARVAAAAAKQGLD